MTNRAPLIIAIVLLLLPVLYVGSYLALVDPATDYRSFAVSTTPDTHFGHYRVASSLLSKVFWPLEQIDRKVRPGAWGISRTDESRPVPKAGEGIACYR